jgi:lysophospholipase L1-like esterase
MLILRSKIILVIILAVLFTSCTQNKLKILIIGDSISIGYTPFVQEKLQDLADVSHNPGNAKYTGNGLDNIETWIGDEKWDIIQFNWGLWDLCYRNPDSKEQGNRDKINGEITFNVDDYGKNLDSIVKLIRKKSNAELIFVTTTYVPEREAGRFMEDAIKYNEIARHIMEANGVKINDIYEVSKEIHLEYGIGNDNVHYTPKGYEELGLQISDFLRNEIKQLTN